jgi:hypothetical protein
MQQATKAGISLLLKLIFRTDGIYTEALLAVAAGMLG